MIAAVCSIVLLLCRLNAVISFFLLYTPIVAYHEILSSTPNWQVSLSGPKHFWLLGLKEALLFIVVVGNLLAFLTGDSCHNRTLSWVLVMVVNDDPFAQEVQLHFLRGFSMVQSDLDAAVSRANTFHIVLLN